MDGVAGDETGILGGVSLGEFYVEFVGGLLAGEADAGFAGIETEAAGGLDRFGDGEVGRPHDAAGADDFAADVNVAFGDADGDIDGVVDFFGDVGIADVLAEFAEIDAGGGEGADVGETDAALVVDLDGVDGGIGNALEGDREAVAAAKLSGGSRGGNGGVGASAGGVVGCAGGEKEGGQGDDERERAAEIHGARFGMAGVEGKGGRGAVGSRTLVAGDGEADFLQTFVAANRSGSRPGEHRARAVGAKKGGLFEAARRAKV